MPSETEIANLAIGHLGAGKPIQNLDTDKTAEARACKLYFPQARDQTLRDYPWPFSKKQVILALVEEEPTIEWAFAYAAPSDMLYARRILSGLRQDTRQSRIPYDLIDGQASLLIHTDMQDACLEYTFKQTNTGRFPSDFTMALSWRLAHYVAPRITRGDVNKLTDRALRHYIIEVRRAMANAGNEFQEDEIPDSEFIIEREGGISDNSQRQDFIDFIGG